MKRAFTLIELLVVIAIIAILAAILFPVFAQAKEAAKKTQDVSNMKQMSTSLLIYSTDVDDLAPLTLPNNQMSFFTTPAERVATTPAGLSLRNSFYTNSLFPYGKNWQIHNGPTQKDWNLFNIPATENPTGYANGYQLNAYLNQWSLSSVTTPSGTIMFWPGFGKDKAFGYGSTYPLPYNKVSGFPVAGGSPWRYDGSGADCVASLGGWSGVNPDYRIFTGGFNLTRTDGHAKFVRAASARSPWAAINNTTGQWASYWITNEQANSGCYHPAWFSPTFELN